ncbi:MAG: GGDEF domain-containing protein [Desulfobacteraceae bacterium]|nr:MAG: GGDEF domain-containing protein [Desulfobacteraceae bacterium]
MDTVSEPMEAVISECENLRSRLRTMEVRCEQAETSLQDIERRNRQLGDSAPFGIFTMDTEGRITGLNHKMKEMLPWPEDEGMLSVTLFEFQPLLEAGIVQDVQRCIELRQTITSNHPCVKSAGTCLHLRFTVSPVLDDGGMATGVLAFVEDITNLKLAEDAIRESEDRYRLLFQSAPVALIERDASLLKKHLESLHEKGIHDLHAYLNDQPKAVAACMGMIKTVDYNEAFLRLIEARNRDELAHGFQPIDSEEYNRMAKEIILMCADGNISREREETIRTIKGNVRNVIIKSLLVTGHEDTYARIVISLVDISMRKQAEDALRASEQHFREQAMRDILTGLYNRRYLYHMLEDLIKAAKQNHTPVSLIFMDLDDFKQVVDSHGHLNGSRAIQEVAATISAGLDKPAFAVAYAGDEFVLVLPGYGQTHAEEKAHHIRSRIQTTAYLKDVGLALSLSASFGIATCPIHATDMNGLLASADKALFAVKANGKNAIGWAGIHD